MNNLEAAIARYIFDTNVANLIAMSDEQWDFILKDQDECAWAGGHYYGHYYHEHEIFAAHNIKYVQTGLREPLL